MNEEMAIVLAKDGHSDACRHLYDQNRERVFRMAYRYARSLEDAEDILQETFIKAFRGIGKFHFRSGSSFSSWITRICIHCSIEHLRKTKRVRLAESIPVQHLALEPASTGVNPEKSIETNQRKDYLNSVLNCLAPKQRLIFDLRFRDHLAVRDIAAHLSCSESTIKTQLSRAVAKLKRRLKPIWGRP